MTHRWLSPALAACVFASAGVPGASAMTALTRQPGTTEAIPQQHGASFANSRTDVQLSNERTLTTWAHPALPLPIYAHPESSSRRVSRIHMYTEDGFAEVYLLLVRHTDAQGRAWIKLRIPQRPNGLTGWVLSGALGTFQHTQWLVVINRRSRRLVAYFQGRKRFAAPVGVGKPSTPTPAGHFWIRERFRLSSRSNPYWPYALGTSAYSNLTDWPGGGVVGIHGDFGQPQLIPGDPSHGCVRMRDRDIAWLAPRLTLGTPVEIS